MVGMAEWQNGRMAGMAGMAVEWQRLATYVLFMVYTDTDNDDTDDNTLIIYSIDLFFVSFRGLGRFCGSVSCHAT